MTSKQTLFTGQLSHNDCTRRLKHELWRLRRATLGSGVGGKGMAKSHNTVNLISRLMAGVFQSIKSLLPALTLDVLP